MVRRWGVRALATAAVLWVLWILSGSPWVTYGLWRDATSQEALFRRTADEVRHGLPLHPGEGETDLAARGYYRVEADHGVVLFYRYKRFRDKGILGIAYAPSGEIPKALQEWARFYAIPPHWSFKRMPEGFYIFAGR